MEKDFVGRIREIKELQKITDSGKAEFIAVYGRRRVGKTYLIQQFFNNRFAFAVSGIIEGSREEELYAFTRALIAIGYSDRQPKTWLEAFDALISVLDKKPHKERRIIYIDELPCFDTPRAGFIHALGYFWNTWASLQKDVILVVCGSATSWMIENIINAHGGLHNRTTHTLYLRQFTLSETEDYLKIRAIRWPRTMIIEAYMMFGGIPYYLSLLDPQESLAQNIDRLYFRKNSELGQEYHRLYASLFKSPEPYMRIVEILGKNKQGLTRNELAENMKVSSNGALSKQLENLEYCDIIRHYVSKVGGKPKSNNAYFQLTDLFTLFHLNFSQKLTTEDYWQQHLNTPVTNTWKGIAFEHVCMAHIEQIRHALGLDRIAVEYYSWRSSSTPKAQIDMIIERADRLVNLCEIKYAQSAYIITSEEDMKIRNRIAAFTRETRTRCGILPTWITPFGLLMNEYSAAIQYQVRMDDLFA